MLHALLEYARQEQLAAKPGLKPKMVRWLLLFAPEGRFLGLQDLRTDDPKSKGREFSACPDLTQQELVAAGCRHFLVDGLDVVCLLSKDDQPDEKLVAKHASFVNLLQQAATAVPVLAHIAAVLVDERQLGPIRADLAGRKAKPTELATFAVVEPAGPTILVEHDGWHAWWQTFRQSMADARKAKAPPATRRKREEPAADPSRMRCLLSGELIDPLPTHNKIEGLSDVGGLSMGDALTSFDKDAFTSFGLEQGANAAMSATAVKTYVTALNHLIRQRSRRMAGVKVAYWYSGPLDPGDDPMREVFEGFGLAPPEEAAIPDDDVPQAATAVAERAQAESCARRLLEAIQTGQRPEVAQYRYYALTLSANSGRVVIRDWMEGQFADLVRTINAWFEDLAIVSRDGQRIVAAHKFLAVLAAPLRDRRDATAPLTTALWRCVLRRQPIPFEIMAQTLNRVRIDLINGETARHARLGLLKAFCNRNERTPDMTAELNTAERDPAYLCGQILAILAKIQQRALGDVGAGVVQRYYAAASATPGLVLGRLVRTAQVGHLPKIQEKGLQRWFESQLADAWAKLEQRPPTVLSLEGQTLFAMGYYHQLAKRFNSTGEKTEEPAATTT